MIAGCSETARPKIIGASKLPSSCCTASTSTATPIAAPVPSVASATSTAATPARIAPITGMNAPKKVSAAKASANGTPIAASPIPINTPSISATASIPLK